MQSFDIIVRVIPMILAIALGFVLTRTGVLKPSMIGGFKAVVVNVCLPASIFGAFIRIRFQLSYLVVIASMIALCFALFFAAKLIARVFRIQSRWFPFLLTGFEAGMMGYPLYTFVFGAASTADFAVVDIGQVLFVFLVFVPMVISSGSGGKGSVKASLRAAAKSPPVWSIVLGLIGALAGLWQLEGTPAYAAIDSVLSFMSLPTAFLICIVIGSGLRLSLRRMKLELLTAALKVLLAFGLAMALHYAVFVPMGVPSGVSTALFVMSVLPAPFVLPVFMKNPSDDELHYVSNTLSLGSLIGVAAFIAVVLTGL